MIKTVHQKVIALMTAFTVFAVIVISSETVNAKAYAAETLTTAQVDAAVAWALQQNGNSSWETVGRTGWNDPWKCESYQNCPQFVRSAFVVGGNDDPNIPVYNPNDWWQMWTNHRHSTTTGIPPKGALAFYDFNSTGHVAISLGDGNVIQGGFSTVCIKPLNGVGGCTYKGWTTWRDMDMTSSDSITAKLDAIVNGTYGNGKYFPYNSDDRGAVPASLAGVAGGRSSFGYARYVFYQLFGIPAPIWIEKTSDELSYDDLDEYGETMREVASCKYSVSPNGNTASISKTALAKAKPGDFIQCRRKSGSSHSMIVYSVSDTSIKILDCDVMLNQPNVILLRDETYSDFAYYNVNFTIYRARNYPG